MRGHVRTFLTVFLVAVMLGSGVAFATGVNVSPRPRICLGNLFGYGDVCGSATPARKKHKKHKKHAVKKHKKHGVKGTTITRQPGFTG